MHRTCWGAIAACFLPPLIARGAVVPIGSEFQVNTYTTGGQYYSAVACNPDGSFVVVWTGAADQDGSDYGIFGQRYDSNGATTGTEFQINTYTTSYQTSSRVCANAAGEFVVVWGSYGPSFSEGDVFVRRYDSNGAPLGSEFLVNTYTTESQEPDGVACTSDGRFVVVWSSHGQDSDTWGIFGQRFAPNGAPLGTEFQVNTYTTGPQLYASIAADDDGDFVVVWTSFYGQDGSYQGVFGQRFASSGVVLGTEFQVNTVTAGFQGNPHVASSASGDFVVVWDGAVAGVRGQRFASSGSLLGTEFLVNTYTTFVQAPDEVAASANGDFVVTWGSYGDGSSGGVFGQRFASSGSPLGTQFQVNTYTTFGQQPSGLCSTAHGRFVVTWDSVGQDGDDLGVFAQRFNSVQGVDHYLCHQVKDLKVPGKFVPMLGLSVVDQTGGFTCEVKKPKLLCNPADKSGSGIFNPNLHYCCYQAKCVPKKVEAAYDITDQFGNLRLQTKKPKFLCNPCDRAPVS
jgi:hypothetical protein